MTVHHERPRELQLSPDRTILAAGRTWFWTALVATALALSFFVGCTRIKSLTPFVEVKSDPAQTLNINETVKYIKRQARQHNMPEEYVSEARIAAAKIQSMLDEARAAELERQAIRQERTMTLNARREEANTRQQVLLAEVDQLKQELEANQERLAATLTAHEREAKATAEKNVKARDILAKERMTDQSDLVSQADQVLAEANAGIEKLRSLRKSTEIESLASLEEMRETSQNTRTRADATVAALRAEAQATVEETKARLTELKTQIETKSKQSQAESSTALAHADAVEKDSRTSATEMQARGDDIAKRGSKEYELKVTIANTDRHKAQAEFEWQGTSVKSEYNRYIAEIDRLRADAQVISKSAESEFTRRLAELDAWFKNSLADVQKIRSAADRIEKVAGANFVKAEANARGIASRETAQHQEALSEAQMRSVIAQAEAEAARVREQILVRFGRKLKKGLTTFDGKTDPAREHPATLHDVPPVPEVAEVTPRIEPEHVAKYRSTLAKVMHERSKVAAQTRTLEATFKERKSKLKVVKAQKIAIATEQLANAEAVKTKADAQRDLRNAEIAAGLAVAKSQFSRDMVEAAAYRKDALARAADLRAGAKATLEKGLAQATALRKKADVVAKNGETSVQTLEALAAMIEPQGIVRESRLLVEADSVKKSEAAQAQQIDLLVDVGERTLAAELSKLERRIETEIIIAQANYQLALKQAEVLGRKTEVDIERLRAFDAVEQSIRQAKAERLHDQLEVDKIKSVAEIERLVAQAQAEREQSDALSDAEEVAIRVKDGVITATVIAQRRIAAARENAVKAMFNARLAQVDSRRIRGRSGVLLAESYNRERFETVLAEIKDARAKSKQRLSQVVKEQKAVDRSSVKNWDARLAKSYQNKM